MNTNSNPEVPRIISTRTWEKRPGASRREFALTAGPGSARGVMPGYWHVLRRRTRMSWRGSWLAKYGPAATPATPSREPQGCIVCSELADAHGNLDRGVGARPRPPLAGSAVKSFTVILAIFRNSCRQRLPRAAGRPEDGPARRHDTGRRRGPGAQARAAPRRDRHGPNPRPPAQVRSNPPGGATRSSTARYFILYRIKVTYLNICAAGGHWSGGSVALAVHPFEQQF
jgi:hypothetical protein